MARLDTRSLRRAIDLEQRPEVGREVDDQRPVHGLPGERRTGEDRAQGEGGDRADSAE